MILGVIHNIIYKNHAERKNGQAMNEAKALSLFKEETFPINSIV
jgi:hypothetical protein